jgi:hypothetical protein
MNMASENGVAWVSDPAVLTGNFGFVLKARVTADRTAISRKARVAIPHGSLINDPPGCDYVLRAFLRSAGFIR